MLLSQDTAPGSSIYRVQAVDKDMGSGGSVSFYLQVTLQPHCNGLLLPLQLQNNLSSNSQIANIFEVELKVKIHKVTSKIQAL